MPSHTGTRAAYKAQADNASDTHKGVSANTVPAHDGHERRVGVGAVRFCWEAPRSTAASKQKARAGAPGAAFRCTTGRVGRVPRPTASLAPASTVAHHRRAAESRRAAHDDDGRKFVGARSARGGGAPPDRVWPSGPTDGRGPAAPPRARRRAASGRSAADAVGRGAGVRKWCRVPTECERCRRKEGILPHPRQTPSVMREPRVSEVEK